MKLIIAYVRPERLRDVKTALSKVEVFRMAIDNVRTTGDAPAIRESYRGADVYVDTHARVRFEIAINDVFVEPAMRAIADAGRTGEDGDGHVLVLNIEQAVRIRDGLGQGDAIA